MVGNTLFSLPCHLVMICNKAKKLVSYLLREELCQHKVRFHNLHYKEFFYQVHLEECWWSLWESRNSSHFIWKDLQNEKQCCFYNLLCECENKTVRNTLLASSTRHKYMHICTHISISASTVKSSLQMKALSINRRSVVLVEELLAWTGSLHELWSYSSRSINSPNWISHFWTWQSEQTE